MSVFTIGSNVFGGGGTPGGAAGGALTGTYPNPLLAGLTTVGAIPYVASTGVLGQDAGFSYDPATDILSASSLTLASTGIIRKGSSLFAHTYAAPTATGQNTFAGVGAGNLTMATPGSATFTSFNTGFGNSVLAGITTGFRLTGFGTSALNAATTGPYNTAFGAFALSKVTTADSNSAFGSDSLRENLGGYNNSAFGTASMTANTSGYSNSAFGNTALSVNVDGFMNTAMGDGALKANTSGTRNTGIGFNALGGNLTGIQNVAIGEGALPVHTNGQYNIAIGPGAMYVHTSGDNNTVVGVSSMLSHLTGGFNVALGQSSLQNSTTGIGNIAIGWQSADALITGDGNIVIGTNIDLPSTSSSNMLSIGNLIYGFGLGATGSSVSSGRVAIGTSTDGNMALEVASSGSSGSVRVWDQTPTTGNTRVFVRGGAGQSGNLQEWQNNAGSSLAVLYANGSFYGTNIQASTAGSLSWDSRSLFTSPTNGTIELKNASSVTSLNLGNSDNGGLITTVTRTITGAVTDAYTAGVSLTPTYTAATAQTVTRHNYLNLANPVLSGAGPAALTSAPVFRFDAAAGTHKAVDAGTTKVTPSLVDAWLIINVNGTLHYIPSYTSKTD